MIERWFVVTLALAVAIDAVADNGAIAHAKPVSDIQVDGSFADWPDDLAALPIQLNGSREIIAPSENYDANFRAGYDLGTNSVYVAIEIVDDVHVVPEDGQGDAFMRHDGVIAYVDFNHSVTGSGAALYHTAGEHRGMLSGSSSWDADVAAVDWSSADAAVQRAPGVTRYEWRFESHKPLAVNTSLGLDFLVVDHDQPGDNADGTLFSWGPGFGKSQGGGRIGDVLLLAPDTRTGRIQGTIAVVTDNPEDKPDPLRVRIQSTADPALWVQAVSDEDGQFEAALPVGKYVLTSVDRVNWVQSKPMVVAAAEPTMVRVRARRTAKVAPMALVPVPMPIELPERGALATFDADDEASFNTVVESLMAYYGIPGASIALVRDGDRVFHNTYGVQNAYSGERVTDDTVFEAASITKAVFAFAANRLVEAGMLDLDKPLYEYLPFEDIAHDERYKKITARYVLSHQTGFPNWRWNNDDGRIDIKFYPGIQYGYSGEGFEYLGRVVAHILDEPLEDIVRREAVALMGFEDNTFFAAGPGLEAQASRGHYAGMTGPHGFPDQIGVAHSMYTEARSFSSFIVNLLAEKGLSEEAYTRMLEPQVATPLDEEDELQWPGRYGLGMHMMNSPVGLAYGHGGNNGNFTCQFELYPEQQMGWVVFTNADTGWLMVNALRRYLVIGTDEDTETVATL